MILAKMVIAVLNFAFMVLMVWVGLHVALRLHRVDVTDAVIATCCLLLLRTPLIGVTTEKSP